MYIIKKKKILYAPTIAYRHVMSNSKILRFTVKTLNFSDTPRWQWFEPSSNLILSSMYYAICHGTWFGRPTTHTAFAKLYCLHLFTFTKAGTSVPDEPCESPTLWAVMSGEGVAYCASSMRNGVNLQMSGIGNDLKQSTP